jgi:mycothiol system anti-sigma-R factor
MTKAAMIPCDQVIAKLWEYLDGELAGVDSEHVRAHLDVCSRCFPQYEFQGAYKVFVRRSAQQEIPPALRRRIFAAILEEESGHPLNNGLRPPLLERVRAAFRRLWRRGTD